MDLNMLLDRHQQALMLQEKAANPEERLAYRDFARHHFVQIRITRARNGAPDAFADFRHERGQTGGCERIGSAGAKNPFVPEIPAGGAALA